MRVTMVAYTCEGGNCPTTYITDRGTVLVQGYDVAHDEALVEVPPALLAQHAQRQGAGRWVATAYPTGRNTVLVPGAVVTDAEALEAVGLPEGESLVEVRGVTVA